jgi:hypothetical protein
MLRNPMFGRLVGIVGIVTGITMLVPPNVGPFGIVIALLSLIPTAWWLILLSRAFLRRLRVSRTDVPETVIRREGATR